MSHPIYGASWEGFAMENLIIAFPDWNPLFFRTAAGVELDLILTKGNRIVAFEFKASSAPSVTKGFWNAIQDLNIDQSWVVAPVNESYPIGENVMVTSLRELMFRGSPL